MAKEKQNAPLEPTQNVAAMETLSQIKVEIVAVDVPFVGSPIGGYDGEQCFRCDLGLLTKEQHRKLRAIRRGYIVQDRRLINGGEVKSMADAVRALIDSIQI